MEYMDDTLSQLMSGETPEEYRNSRMKILSDLDRLESYCDKFVIETIEDYDKVYELKGHICLLWCFAANNNLPEFDRVDKIDASLGERLFAFIKKHKVKDKSAKAVARYVLWGRYYLRQNMDSIYQTLIDNDLLRRSNDNFYIIRLHYKTGDNTFTVGKGGKESRNYCNSCGLQAIPITSNGWVKYLRDKENDISILEDRYGIVYQVDAKYGIRNISLSKEERNIIIKEYLR